jgi:hypothetical protein
MNYCIVNIFKKENEGSKEAWMKMINQVFQANDSLAMLFDLYLSSRAIYISMAMAFVYSIVYIYLMSAFAEYIAWAVIGAIQIGLFVLSFFAGAAALSPDAG